MDFISIIQTRIDSMLPRLDKRQRRIYLGTEAKSIGRGGITLIARLASVTRRTISKGIRELSENDTHIEVGHVRKSGGGRKKEFDKQPELLNAIRDIVDPHTMGDPMNPLIWSSKSCIKIKEELVLKGFKICHEVVRKGLKSLGFSLQSNKKTNEGGNSPDRDAQFQHINDTAKEYIESKDPVISVDCKKKELVGEYKNGGQEWAPVKNPVEVNVYDFIDKTNGKASPYGVYDLQNNRG